MKMKILRLLTLCIGGLLCITNVHAQTADEIISKYINALGGINKIKGITSIYKESDIELNGNTATAVTYILNNKAYKMEMNFNGAQIIQCVTKNGGWQINPMMGKTSPEPFPEDQVRAAQEQLAVEGPLVDYAKKGSTVQLLGKENVNGSNTYKLKVTTKEKVELTLYIDAVNYHITKVESKALVSGQVMQTSTTFSNYIKTDYGYVVPFTEELVLPQGTIMLMNDKKVEINKHVDPAIFEMPRN